jgi:hypothetical protein
MTALVVGATAFSAASQYAAGQASGSLMNMNAGLARQQAQSEEAAGAYNESLVRRKYANVEGQQVNSIGANNLQMSGSALRLISDTAKTGEMDALQTRNNALRRAYGFQVQAAGDTYEAGVARSTGTSRAVGTALSGAADIWGGT